MLQNYKLIAAFRRRKNLQDYLITAKLQPLITPQPRTQTGFLQQHRWIRNCHTNQIFKIDPDTRPSSQNCMCLIYCSTCRKQYVGETGNIIASRFYQYKYNILRQQKAPIPGTVLESNPRWSPAQRRRAERKWTRLLDTILLHGLNDIWWLLTCSCSFFCLSHPHLHLNHQWNMGSGGSGEDVDHRSPYFTGGSGEDMNERESPVKYGKY